MKAVRVKNPMKNSNDKTKQLIGHLMIIKEQECFPKTPVNPYSMAKLAVNESAMKTRLVTILSN